MSKLAVLDNKVAKDMSCNTSTVAELVSSELIEYCMQCKKSKTTRNLAEKIETINKLEHKILRAMFYV